MANEKNLIPVSERTSSELREMTSKGGKASGAARRRKKNMKETLNALLAMPINDVKTYNETAAMGIDPDNLNYQAAMAAAMVKEAIESRNVKAFLAVCDLVGAGSDAERTKIMRDKFKLEKERADAAKVVIEDDGFIEALNGTASEDWKDDE